MATTYMIDFTTTVGATRCIVADSEEQALMIANELLLNDAFEEGLWASINDNMIYAVFNDPQILDSDDEWLPDYDDEDWQEIYGIDMKALREEN